MFGVYNKVKIRQKRIKIRHKEEQKMLKITLAAARVNAGLTQKEVADMLDVSNKTVCNWENGKSYPSPKQIDMLCEIYGISYDNIIFLPTNSL